MYLHSWFRIEVQRLEQRPHTTVAKLHRNLFLSHLTVWGQVKGWDGSFKMSATRILLACCFTSPGCSLVLIFQDVLTTLHFSGRKGEGKRGPGLFKDMIWKLHRSYFCSHLIGQNLVMWPFLAIKEAGTASFILVCYVFSYKLYIKESENIHEAQLAAIDFFHSFIHQTCINLYHAESTVPGAQAPDFTLFVV